MQPGAKSQGQDHRVEAMVGGMAFSFFPWRFTRHPDEAHKSLSERNLLVSL